MTPPNTGRIVAIASITINDTPYWRLQLIGDRRADYYRFATEAAMAEHLPSIGDDLELGPPDFKFTDFKHCWPEGKEGKERAPSALIRNWLTVAEVFEQADGQISVSFTNGDVEQFAPGIVAVEGMQYSRKLGALRTATPSHPCERWASARVTSAAHAATDHGPHRVILSLEGYGELSVPSCAHAYSLTTLNPFELDRSKFQFFWNFATAKLECVNTHPDTITPGPKPGFIYPSRNGVKVETVTDPAAAASITEPMGQREPADPLPIPASKPSGLVWHDSVQDGRIRFHLGHGGCDFPDTDALVNTMLNRLDYLTPKEPAPAVGDNVVLDVIPTPDTKGAYVFWKTGYSWFSDERIKADNIVNGCIINADLSCTDRNVGHCGDIRPAYLRLLEALSNHIESLPGSTLATLCTVQLGVLREYLVQDHLRTTHAHAAGYDELDRAMTAKLEKMGALFEERLVARDAEIVQLKTSKEALADAHAKLQQLYADKVPTTAPDLQALTKAYERAMDDLGQLKGKYADLLQDETTLRRDFNAMSDQHEALKKELQLERAANDECGRIIATLKAEARADAASYGDMVKQRDALAGAKSTHWHQQYVSEMHAQYKEAPTSRITLSIDELKAISDAKYGNSHHSIQIVLPGVVKGDLLGYHGMRQDQQEDLRRRLIDLFEAFGYALYNQSTPSSVLNFMPYKTLGDLTKAKPSYTGALKAHARLAKLESALGALEHELRCSDGVAFDITPHGQFVVSTQGKAAVGDYLVQALLNHSEPGLREDAITEKLLQAGEISRDAAFARFGLKDPAAECLKRRDDLAEGAVLGCAAGMIGSTPSGLLKRVDNIDTVTARKILGEGQAVGVSALAKEAAIEHKATGESLESICTRKVTELKSLEEKTVFPGIAYILKHLDPAHILHGDPAEHLKSALEGMSCLAPYPKTEDRLVSAAESLMRDIHGTADFVRQVHDLRNEWKALRANSGPCDMPDLATRIAGQLAEMPTDRKGQVKMVARISDWIEELTK